MTTPFSPGKHLRKTSSVAAHTRGRYTAACPVGLNRPKSPYGSSRRSATSARAGKAATKISKHRTQNLFCVICLLRKGIDSGAIIYNPLRRQKLLRITRIGRWGHRVTTPTHENRARREPRGDHPNARKPRASGAPG